MNFVIAEWFAIDWDALWKTITDSITYTLKEFLAWYMEFMASVATPLIETVIPPSLDGSTTLSDAFGILAQVNCIMPLKEGILMYSLYFGFLTLYSTIKIIIKLIPTVG